MEIIGWIVLGLAAGAIAKLLLPGDDPGGIFMTILLGVAGAIVGGLIGNAIGFTQDGDKFDFGTLITAVIGSIVLLLLYRVIAGRRATRTV